VRRAPLLAVAVSGLLGVVSGVVGGVVLDRGQSSFADPLGVGVPMVEQPCQPLKSLLVLGSGGAQSAVAAAVSSVSDPDVRYLDTRRSCHTTWTRAGRRPSHYVVYLGPLSTQAACQRRMTAGVQGHLVTRLRSGAGEPVQCLCYVSYTSMPVLRPNAETTTTDTIFIRSLQDLLAHMGRNSPAHVNGLYDSRTQAAIQAFQQQRGLPANGDVNTDTWHALQKLGCRHYKG
jgi:murein L,D-transpeptidase YcbB/YkuD